MKRSWWIEERISRFEETDSPSLQMLLQYNTETHSSRKKHSGSKEYACKRLMVNFALRRMKYEIYYKYKEAVTRHSLLFPFISDWQLQFDSSCIRSSSFFLSFSFFKCIFTSAQWNKMSPPQLVCFMLPWLGATIRFWGQSHKEFTPLWFPQSEV